MRCSRYKVEFDNGEVHQYSLESMAKFSIIDRNASTAFKSVNEDDYLAWSMGASTDAAIADYGLQVHVHSRL